MGSSPLLESSVPPTDEQGNVLIGSAPCEGWWCHYHTCAQCLKTKYNVAFSNEEVSSKVCRKEQSRDHCVVRTEYEKCNPGNVVGGCTCLFVDSSCKAESE